MRIREALTTLLACAEGELETPVCRSFIHPGANAPHDNCQESDGSNGQLWVAHITDTGGWPESSATPVTCRFPFAVTIELGIVRCAKGILKDGDDFLPEPEDVTADSLQQDDDRVALKNAILCCWGVSGRDMLPPQWTPIEPFGGCVGGAWRVVIRDSACLCAPPSEGG